MMDGTITNIRKVIRGVIFILILASIFGYAYQHDTAALKKDLEDCREFYGIANDKLDNLTNKTYFKDYSIDYKKFKESLINNSK